MAFTFREAKRESVGLLIGLSGGTGSGKTFSAFRLAKGIAGDKPFAVIDTEAGRAKHYADQFKFDHGDLTPPFTPDRYIEAIVAADNAKYPVIIVDSMSHEWAGDGGILDWHDDELDRMSKGDSSRREALTMAAWIKPKMAHKQMVQRLLQVRAHLILCFRAEPKIEIAKENGKTVIREKKGLTALHGWFPVTEKSLPFELTASFLLLADKPGYPLPIKCQEQHKALFPLDKPINEESGARVAAWAKGGTAAATSAPEVDWLAKIAAVRTKAELDTLAMHIAAVKDALSPAMLTTLRAALKAWKPKPSEDEPIKDRFSDEDMNDGPDRDVAPPDVETIKW